MCPIDFKRVENFIRRAKKDLSSARLLQTSDLEAAYQLLYEGMLHSGLALMSSEGLQPDIRGKHKTVMEYVAYALGKSYASKIQFYDRMRRRRHQLIYEPSPFGCTEKEITDAQKVLEEFHSLIADEIQKRNPQKQFHLE